MSVLPMRFYTINDTFIAEMKALEPKIQNNYGGARPYIGVLLIVNGLNYYAPLSSYKVKQDRIRNITVFKLHEKGNPDNKLGVIHINNMFPVPLNQLNEVVIDLNDSYGLLLQNQYEFILHNQDNIQMQAKKLYDKVSLGDSFLSSLSCNFKLLETHVAKKSIAPTPQTPKTSH